MSVTDSTYILLQHYWWFLVSVLGALLVFLLFVQGGQSLLFTIFSLLGMYVNVEVSTPKGRVDMVMRTPTTLYVVE